MIPLLLDSNHLLCVEQLMPSKIKLCNSRRARTLLDSDAPQFPCFPSATAHSGSRKRAEWRRTGCGKVAPFSRESFQHRRRRRRPSRHSEPHHPSECVAEWPFLPFPSPSISFRTASGGRRRRVALFLHLYFQSHFALGPTLGSHLCSKMAAPAASNSI